METSHAVETLEWLKQFNYNIMVIKWGQGQMTESWKTKSQIQKVERLKYKWPKVYKHKNKIIKLNWKFECTKMIWTTNQILD